MVSLKELEQVVSSARKLNLKIIIRFRKTRNSILIDKEIKALDEYGKVTSWSRAFSIPPNQAIDTYTISSIEVLCGDEVIAAFNRWSDLLRSLNTLQRCET